MKTRLTTLLATCALSFVSAEVSRTYTNPAADEPMFQLYSKLGAVLDGSTQNLLSIPSVGVGARYSLDMLGIDFSATFSYARWHADLFPLPKHHELGEDVLGFVEAKYHEFVQIEPLKTHVLYYTHPESASSFYLGLGGGLMQRQCHPFYQKSPKKVCSTEGSTAVSTTQSTEELNTSNTCSTNAPLNTCASSDTNLSQVVTNSNKFFGATLGAVVGIHFHRTEAFFHGVEFNVSKAILSITDSSITASQVPVQYSAYYTVGATF